MMSIAHSHKINTVRNHCREFCKSGIVTRACYYLVILHCTLCVIFQHIQADFFVERINPIMFAFAVCVWAGARATKGKGTLGKG